MKKTIIIALFTGLLVLFVTPAHGITWCHDYSLSVVSNTNPNRTDDGSLRISLSSFGYNRKFTIAPNVSTPSQKLECGDVIIIGNDHSGVVNNQGGIDHYLQPVVGGKTTPIPYDPAPVIFTVKLPPQLEREGFS
jgi:hypothetical protein